MSQEMVGANKGPLGSSCRSAGWKCGVFVGMALSAEGNQVLFCVIAGMAAEFFVMHFELRHCAAVLTPPAIAAQHLIVKFLVGLPV
jgi:hypothetical protein